MLPLLRDLPTNHGSPGMKKPMTSMLSSLEKLSSSHAAPLWSSVAVHLPLTEKPRQTRAFQCEATVKTSLLENTWARTDHDFRLGRLLLCPLRFTMLSDSELCSLFLNKRVIIKYTKGVDKHHKARD